MKRIEEILPVLERLSEQEVWGADDTLLVKYHKALKEAELIIEEQKQEFAEVELEATKNWSSEMEYLKEKLNIITPALEALTKESLEMYNKELDELDNRYEKF